MKRITIYCASSAQIAPKYFEAAERLTKILVAQNIEIVCGGGANGLMGKLADTCLASGGKITGIMPHFMKAVEWNHPGIENLIWTETMSERKLLLLENIDALVALPGGTGTLEELFEAITLKRLGKFLKPIIILNTDGYYDDLKRMLNKCIDENFMAKDNLLIWNFVDEPEDVLPAIYNAAVWDESAIHSATLK